MGLAVVKPICRQFIVDPGLGGAKKPKLFFFFIRLGAHWLIARPHCKCPFKFIIGRQSKFVFAAAGVQAKHFNRLVDSGRLLGFWRPVAHGLRELIYATGAICRRRVGQVFSERRKMVLFFHCHGFCAGLCPGVLQGIFNGNSGEIHLWHGLCISGPHRGA